MRRLLLALLLAALPAWGQSVMSSGPCRMDGSDCYPYTGTVTSVGSGTISGLFTASWATATTTPALSLAMAAAAANTALRGPATGADAAPTFRGPVAADFRPYLYEATTNTALGSTALNRATTGATDTAIGYHALAGNTSGTDNAAVGAYSLEANLAGGGNTAAGNQSLQLNTGGSGNTAIGMYAGYMSGASPGNANAVTTGNFNTFLGYTAGLGSATQRTNATAIGNGAYVDADNTVVLGNGAVTEVKAGSTGAANVTAGSFAGPVTALKSATTSVDVSASPAPSTGQVLKATDSAHATWQTLSAGLTNAATTNVVPKVDSGGNFVASAITDNGTTVTSTLPIVVPVGAYNAPSIKFSGTSTGFYTDSGTTVAMTVGGVIPLYASNSVVVSNLLLRVINNIQLGADSDSPVARTIYGEGGRNGISNNATGGALTDRPGLGTGNTLPGKRYFDGDVPGSSGTTAHATVHRMVLNGYITGLTSGGATSVLDIALTASPQAAGGKILCSIYASDGTDIQSVSGTVRWSAIRTGAGPTYAGAAGTAGAPEETVIASTGTLSSTWALVSGTNKMTLQITPTSTVITPTSFILEYKVLNHSDQQVTPL